MQNILTAKNIKLSLGFLTAFALMLMFQMDFASAAESGWTTTVETEMKTAGADVTSVLLKILVVALGIFALQFGVKKAMKFFKSTTN